MVVTSYSRFLTSRVPDTSESLGHFAESTLLSHDKVSDDLTWSTSTLIIRLYFLVGTGIDARGLCRKIRRRRSTPRAFSKSSGLQSRTNTLMYESVHSQHTRRAQLKGGLPCLKGDGHGLLCH